MQRLISDKDVHFLFSQSVNLSNCDREPIHIPSTIQPHGALIVAESPPHGRILQYSENLGDYFETVLRENPIKLLLTSLFPEALLLEMERAFASLSAPGRYARFTCLLKGRPHQIVLHQASGLAVLEIEPLAQGQGQEQEQEGGAPDGWRGRVDFAWMDSVDGLEPLCMRALEEFRSLADFGRILIYRFDPHFNGEVIAELKEAEYESFLGLHFPSTDIPKQARDLYRRNPYRLISDANYEPVRVVPKSNPKTTQPLDMTYCTIRSVSPMHLQYMKNMGLTSSMSVSLQAGGELWGLVSFHAREPRTLSFVRRERIVALAEALGARITRIEQQAASQEFFALQSKVDALRARVKLEMSDREIREFLTQAMAAFSLDSAVFLFEDLQLSVGDPPTGEVIEQVAGFLPGLMTSELFSTDQLVQFVPQARDTGMKAAGLIALRLPHAARAFLLGFRQEFVRTVKWAGYPVKNFDAELSPRASFEEWKQVLKFQSRPWSRNLLEAFRRLGDLEIRLK